jgi:hypothetical protein
MKSFTNYAALFLFPLLLSYATVPSIGDTLQGTVVNRDSGKPIAAVYLYTVQGEEEAVTNREGAFRFTTWQKFPLVIYLRNENNEDVRFTISQPSKKILVKL